MKNDKRTEQIFSGDGQPSSSPFPGITVRSFASEASGAIGFSTGILTFQPGAKWPCDVADVGEAMTVLNGKAHISIAGRSYELTPLDCVHVPAEVPYSMENGGPAELKIHVAYASARPSSRLTAQNSNLRSSGSFDLDPNGPEYVRRFVDSDSYELAPGTAFRDLFARRFGTAGICGGYGAFEPGTSLPCHIHDYDESITIVRGRAVCLVQGARYELSAYDTAFVPQGRPHRFLNDSDDLMAMIWVYAGDEPDRRIVNASYCSGDLVLPEQLS